MDSSMGKGYDITKIEIFILVHLKMEIFEELDNILGKINQFI